MEGQQQQILNPQVSELLDRTGQMRLDGRRPPMRPTFQRNGNGGRKLPLHHEFKNIINF